MIYKDTESGEVVTERELRAEFETLRHESPEEHDYSFTEYIRNCTDKNGFLEVV
jgi:hypothetical protein